MKGLARYGVGNVARVRHGGTEHDDSCVVIVHGKPTIVFRPSHLANVLPVQHTAAREVSRIGKGAGSIGGGIPDINDHGGSVICENMTEAISVNLGHAAQGPPDGDAELVAADVTEPGREQLLRQALALSAVRAIAVEHKRGRFVALDESAHLGHVGDIHRRCNVGLRGNVQRVWDMTDCILEMRTRVEHDGAALRQDPFKLTGGNLRCTLAGLAQDGVEDGGALNPYRSEQDWKGQCCQYHRGTCDTGGHGYLRLRRGGWAVAA